MQDKKKVFDSALDQIQNISPRFHWVGVYVLENEQLHLRSYRGEPTIHEKISIGTGLCGLAVEKNTDLNIGDVHQESRYLSCSPKTKSELIVLIRDHDQKILGQIDIDGHDFGLFSDQEVEEVKKIAKNLGEKFELWQK